MRLLLAAILPLCAALFPKRGLSGLASCQDASALNLEQSWHYNWGVHPTPSTRPCKRAAEFVPMIWSCYDNCTSGLPSNYSQQWKQAGVRYLLGFNEPDNPSQSNLSPAAAAAFWPQLQALAAGFDPPLSLVAPAMTHWESTTGRSSWLDQFLSNCSTSVAQACNPALIKHVAFHDYGGSAQGIMTRADSAARIYKRPVWLTEFAVGYGKDRAANDAFMRQILPKLDAAESIFRYAWYSTRNRPSSWVNQSSLLPYLPAPHGSWVRSDHTTCAASLIWIGQHGSIAKCQQAAVASAKCRTPKVVAYESGDVQNCYCSTGACEKKASSWLTLYTQEAVANPIPGLDPTSTGIIYMGNVSRG